MDSSTKRIDREYKLFTMERDGNYYEFPIFECKTIRQEGAEDTFRFMCPFCSTAKTGDSNGKRYAFHTHSADIGLRKPRCHKGDARLVMPSGTVITNSIGYYLVPEGYIKESGV